jgi:hypothetical protein
MRICDSVQATSAVCLRKFTCFTGTTVQILTQICVSNQLLIRQASYQSIIDKRLDLSIIDELGSSRTRKLGETIAPKKKEN